MDSYFKALHISENIFHIYEPGGVHTTLIIGNDRAMLIDTGYGFGNLAGFVRTLTDKPVDVVLTHGHVDHCGGNWQFPSVHMNLADIPTYLWYETTQKPIIIEKFKRDREKAGMPPVWPEDFNEKNYLAQHTRHFEPLEEGQIFDLGGRKEEILFLPGHTKGSVVILDHQTGLLFSGDNISDSLWIFFNTSATLTQYASKLMDIARMPGIRGILPSHRGQVLPAGIMRDILMAIGNIDPETDSDFAHPRTGQKALRHKEKCTAAEGIQYIYVVYDKEKI